MIRQFIVSALGLGAVISAGAAEMDVSSFAKKSTLTFSGYSGTSELTDFPVLVRLSPTTVKDFSYARFKQADYSDLVFTDAEGNELAYDVDTWNPNGESLVWVRVPRLVGTETSILMYLGSETPPARTLSAADVWTPHYAGVWHWTPGEADATGHGYTVAFRQNEDASATVTDNGFLGGGLRQTKKAQGARVASPKNSIDGISNPPLSLTVSGWYKPSNVLATQRLICWKGGSGEAQGFDFIANYSGSTTFAMVRGSGGTSSATPKYTLSWANGNWYHVAATYTGTTGSAYLNGTQLAAYSGSKTTIPETKSNGDVSVGFGQMAGTGESYAFFGDLDELRFYNGAASTDWLTAEYKTAAEASFTTYGALVNTKEGSIDFGGAPTIVSKEDGSGFTVSIVAECDNASIEVAFTDLATGETKTFALGQDVTLANEPISADVTGLEPNSTYTYCVVGHAAAGDVIANGAGLVINAPVTIVKTADAVEQGRVAGVFVVTRPGTTGDLTLTYDVTGTAVPGRTYRVLSGTVTIPDGESAVEIAVEPNIDNLMLEDATVTVSLVTDRCLASGESAATLTVINDAEAVFDPRVRYLSTTGDDLMDGTTTDSTKATLQAAVDALGPEGGTVYVTDGDYVCTPQGSEVEISAPVAIVGLSSDPTRVILRAADGAASNGRLVKLDHPDARVSFVTLQNGHLSASPVQCGGNVLITANGGEVTDCILDGGSIRGELPTDQSQKWSQGGGNVRLSGGALRRCVVKNGRLASAGLYGSGIYAEGSARVEDCLIVGNESYSTASDDGGAAVRLDGSSKLINCTVVGNRSNRYPGLFFPSQIGTELKVINCVFADNHAEVEENPRERATNLRYGNHIFSSCFDTEVEGGTKTCRVLAHPGFVSSATGDYHLLPQSELIDAGDSSVYNNTTDPMDLDRQARIKGEKVDIGCYEYDQSAAALWLKADRDKAFLTAETAAEVTLTAGVYGVEGDVSYAWDFGDGTTGEGAEVVHHYLTAGEYMPQVTATFADGTMSRTLDYAIAIRPRTMYLNVNGSNVAPYATPETGATNPKSIIDYAIEGNTILVEPGEYDQSPVGQLFIEKDIALVGRTGNPADVVFTYKNGNKSRNLVVEAEGAFIANLTMADAYITGARGGNLYLSNGVVSNCVLRYGTTYNAGEDGAGAYVKGGLLTHSVIDQPLLTRRGNGIFVSQYGGRVSNCLMKNNRQNTDNSHNAAALVFVKSGVMENCTIVQGNLRKVGTGNNSDIGQSADIGFCLKSDGDGKIINCVMAGVAYFDSEETPTYWAGKAANFVNCVTEGETPINDTCKVGTTATLFADYAHGNFAPNRTGVLLDGGTTTGILDPTPAVDLAGKKRVVKTIDIGCYEAQAGFVVIIQ